MKRKDITKLHSSTASELQQKLEELQKQLVITKLDVRMGKQTNLKIPMNIRRDIARIRTILREQELQTKKDEK